MRTAILALLAILVLAPRAQAQAPGDRGRTRFPRREKHYDFGPDSVPRKDVPRGRVYEFVWNDSKVFPGTIRKCAAYVPQQYDGSKPAALMVFQDGVRHYLMMEQDFRVPIVFDNLIAAGDMPVTIGVFVDPGYTRTELPREREERSSAENRSIEYDSLGPKYAEFLLTEILPHVEKQYNVELTHDPAGRAICGMSSGGICAFTVAWERPDQFGKVVSHVGSFTNIRGGHAYPALIRAAEPKPIRVFLQDGDNDNRNRRPEMNWVVANHNMAAALEEMDYDYKYVLGEGGHSGNHGGAIFPDTMRWLWRDSPK
jgi:enterochelin esterase family protein